MLPLLYFGYNVVRLNLRWIPRRARNVMFGRRLCGLFVGLALSAIFGHDGSFLDSLLLWGCVLVGELWAREHAREEGLPGADGPRLPVY